MPNVKILLGGITLVWKQIFREFADSTEGLEIVGEVHEPLDLLLQAKELRPDVVVLSQLEHGGEPGICSHLLLEYPNLGVVLLPTNTGAGRLSWMVLGKGMMQDASRASLRAALREIYRVVGSGSS